MTSNNKALKLNFFSDDTQRDLDRNICRFIAGQLGLERVLENIRCFSGNGSKFQGFPKYEHDFYDDILFDGENEFRPSLMNDGILRVSQSLINQLSEERVSLAKYTELINKFTTTSIQPQTELIQKLFQLLQPIFIVLQFDSTSNAKVHRNACLILLIVLKNENSTLNSQIKSQLLAYLTKLITSAKPTEEDETKLFSLILIEKFCSNQKVQIQKQLISALKKIIDFQGSALFDPIRYQLEFLAEWYLDNEFHHSARDEPGLLKLFPNCLSARTDSTRFPTVRCAFKIKSGGVYYYEATLLTDGHMQIGWCTQQSRFTPKDGVGNEWNSISFDGFNLCIWQGRAKHTIKDVSRWKAGDVVGCLVDADKSEFVFYLNGKQLTQSPFKLEQPIGFGQSFWGPNSFDSEPMQPIFQPHNPYNPSKMYSHQGPSTPKIYYAAASLATYQQINFNFGQSPFRFTPQVIGKSFSSFNSKSKSSIEYQLQEPAFRNGEFYFH